MSFAAVILAGGKASRLSGLDKAQLEVGGKTLLRTALDAVAGATPVVVVGPRREFAGDLVWAREDPPGSGPLAGLAAGLAAVPAEADEVAVLAADLVGVTPATIGRLRAALAATPEAGGAVLVDRAGVRQWLLGVWRISLLRKEMPPEPQGLPVRHVLGALRPVEVAAGPGETADVDTPEDLERVSSQQSHR
jgi:molybdopterin-guanine dinucleotide biosynthesis protein A